MLLHKLGLLSICCRECESLRLGVQQWTWVNLLVLLPPPPSPKSTFLKEISSQLHVRLSKYLSFVFLYYKHQKINLKRSSWTSTSKSHWNFLICVFHPLAKQKGLQVKKMLNHNLFQPFLSLSTVVICLQTLVHVGSIFLCVHVKEMEWSDKHDLVLCQEVLVLEPYQHPYRSNERGDVWNQIAVNMKR